MARKDQVLVIALRYDDTEESPPETWDWPTLLDMPAGDVKVILAGPVTNPGDAVTTVFDS